MRARFVIAAVGLLSAHYVPDIPGIGSFKGEPYHTSRWPKEKVDFTGKRVAVIGPGATAVQLIPYLPGVSRPTLRATEECPTELRPLAELQSRASSGHNPMARTGPSPPSCKQTDKGGLGFHVAKDKATVASIQRALDKLLNVPVAELRAKSLHDPLDSNDFDSLVSDDPVHDLLTWLADPAGTKQRWDESRWETLCRQCKSD